MSLSFTFALSLLTPCVVAIALVRWWLAPRRLEARSFVTIPLVGLATCVLALIAEVVIRPDGLKQRVADIAALSAIAAGTEELAKLLGLALVLRRKRAVADTTSTVATGLLVGLGFAFGEGIARTFAATAHHVSWLAILGRAVVSTPGHAAYTGLVAWMVARRRVEQVRPGGMPLGLALAMIAHFAFDAIGLAPQLAEHVWPAQIGCRTAQAFIVWAILVRLLRRSSLPPARNDIGFAREGRGRWGTLSGRSS